MRVSTTLFQELSVNRILDQQARLSEIQQQLSTGRRILTPSDDPTGSARALDLAKSIETIETYNRNADFAESRMRTEESVLGEVGNVIQRVRELTVQANNGSQSAEDRRKIGAEVRERLDQLLALANSTDGNGEYLFAGNSTRTQPFLRTGGEVAYQGDQAERRIQVGPNRQMATTHSGFDVFMRIPTGDGELVTRTPDSNSGSGVISPVSVTDATATRNLDYDISFADVGGTLEYTVTDGGGTTVASGVFEEGAPIEFDGLSVSVDGEPAPGDGFQVARSRPQSLFETVDRLADALEGASDTAAGRAAYLNEGNRALQDLDQALENVLEIRAELGGRLNRLDQERTTNEDAVLELKKTKSGIEDLDYASAVSELNLSLTGLRAAQQSYTRIQGLSLFNYL